MLEIEFMDDGDPGATEILQDVFLFRNLDFQETSRLLEICHIERRPVGEKIIEENAVGQGLYIVNKGKVKVYKGDSDAVEPLAILERGQMFGEMSLVEDALTSANVMAQTEIELIVIRRVEFEKLLAENERLALKIYKSFCKVLSERLRKTTTDLFEKYTPSKGVV